MIYPCLTCDVQFPLKEQLILHHDTSWHNYNIKRLMCELECVTLDAFKQCSISKEPKKVDDKTSVYCKPCKKKFVNMKSYTNHSKSNKHISLDQLRGTDIEQVPPIAKEKVPREIIKVEEFEEIDSDEWDGEWELEGIPVTQCLFCSLKFDSIENSLMHMGKFHSFQIPDLQYCVDITLLMEYLGSKVGSCNRCLYCNKFFDDLVPLQKHMKDKWHMRIDIDGGKVLEYSDFYDYASTYPDAENASPGDDVNLNVLVPNESFELVLPSGTVIGHKALARYCSRSSRIRALAAVNTKNNTCIKSLSGYYQSIGWKGATKAELVRRAKDIRTAAAVRQKSYMRLGVKANKMQPHFRLQILI